MKTIHKLALGITLLTSTQTFGARTSSETIGNAVFAKAYITCDVDNKKNFINETVNIDSIGFDYTKFIPMLATRGSVSCKIKGNIQLPDDFLGDTVDIEAGKSKGFVYARENNFQGCALGSKASNKHVNNGYAAIVFNGQEDESVLREAPEDSCKTLSDNFKAGRFFNVPVKKHLGLKYVEFEITQQIHVEFVDQSYGGKDFSFNSFKDMSFPGIHMEKFFKEAENFQLKYMKTAQARGERTEFVPLDKFFILQKR